MRSTSSGGGSGSGPVHGAARCVDETTIRHVTTQVNRFIFTYDSGAECSLVKESFVSKFSGKRVCNVFAITGTDQTRVFSPEQILCCVYM